MNTELKSLLKSVIEEALQPIKEDIKNLQTGQSELYQLTRVIHDRQEETDARLEAFLMDQHKWTGEVVSLSQGQERQERILSSLALRSLEQETELRELKRA